MEPMNKVEKWLSNALIGLASLVSTYAVYTVQELNSTINTAVTAIATIKRELEIVRPRDVLEAVNTLAQSSLQREQVAAICRAESPWRQDRPDWREWRKEVSVRLRSLEQEVAKERE